MCIQSALADNAIIFNWEIYVAIAFLDLLFKTVYEGTKLNLKKLARTRREINIYEIYLQFLLHVPLLQYFRREIYLQRSVRAAKNSCEKCPTVKSPYEEISLRQSFLTAKYIYGETSLRLNFLTAKQSIKRRNIIFVLLAKNS